MLVFFTIKCQTSKKAKKSTVSYISWHDILVSLGKVVFQMIKFQLLVKALAIGLDPMVFLNIW